MLFLQGNYTSFLLTRLAPVLKAHSNTVADSYGFPWVTRLDAQSDSSIMCMTPACLA